MYTVFTNEKVIDIFQTTEPGAPIIYLNTFSSEGQKVFEALRGAGSPSFTLVAISGLDWNHDMVPWDVPPAFKSTNACTGGADDYLRLLTEKILPMVEEKVTGVPCWRGIAGYSLAGLFALYAIYQTDLFSRVGNMSGSLWVPGIKQYILSCEPKRSPDCIYFSLGERESKTRNSVLRSVRQNTEEIQSFYQARGISTVFQLNPGGHYAHVTERTAAGITWMLSQ